MRLLFLLVLLTSEIAFSQDYVTYKVEPGEKVTAALPVTVKYSYAQFQPGTVYFRDGKASRANLNYSHLFGQMQFLKGADTLYLDRVEDVNYIAVENDSFYYQNKIWVRQFASAAKIRLAEHRVLDFANQEKLGPYGGKSAGSVEMVQSIDVPGVIDKSYTAREVLFFIERNSYYFSDKFGRFYLANKKNIVDMFGKANTGIEKYLVTNKPDYTRREDMLTLLDYLAKSQ